MGFQKDLERIFLAPNPNAPTATERFKSAWDYLVAKPGKFEDRGIFRLGNALMMTLPLPQDEGLPIDPLGAGPGMRLTTSPFARTPRATAYDPFSNMSKYSADERALRTELEPINNKRAALMQKAHDQQPDQWFLYWPDEKLPTSLRKSSDYYIKDPALFEAEKSLRSRRDHILHQIDALKSNRHLTKNADSSAASGLWQRLHQAEQEAAPAQ